MKDNENTRRIKELLAQATFFEGETFRKLVQYISEREYNQNKCFLSKKCTEDEFEEEMLYRCRLMLTTAKLRTVNRRAKEYGMSVETLLNSWIKFTAEDLSRDIQRQKNFKTSKQKLENFMKGE